MPIFGVDVSKHQGSNLDWAGIRTSGIDFMIARASLATTPDPMYATNIARARAAGIPIVGAYHFLYPDAVVSPIEQAQCFVGHIGRADGLLTVLDVEKDRGPGGTVYAPGIAEVVAFATEFARLTGNHPLILYAPAWYWTGTIGDPPAAALGPLHASRYVPVARDAAGAAIRMTPEEAFAKVPAAWWQASHGGWTTATILQFTSSGKVAGYGGPIDIDVFRGSLDDLMALTASAAAGSTSSPEPSDDVVAASGQEPSGDVVPASDPDPATEVLPGFEPNPATGEFYTVVAGDTLSRIAARHGFLARGEMPAFMVLIEAFPENARYADNPNLINVGDQVRIR